MLNKKEDLVTKNRNQKSLIAFGAMGAHINMALQALKASELLLGFPCSCGKMLHRAKQLNLVSSLDAESPECDRERSKIESLSTKYSILSLAVTFESVFKAICFSVCLVAFS